MKRSKKLPKPRKGAWFVAVRGSYLPVTWQAWLLYVPYVYYLVATLWMVIHDTSSLGTMVINLVPYWVAGVAVMTWIAKQKS